MSFKQKLYMVPKYIWLIVLVILLYAYNLGADTIYMKNGEVIEGKIISNENGVIVIHEKFEGFGYGEATYHIDNVNQIVTPEELIIIENGKTKTLNLNELKTVIDAGLGQYALMTGLSLEEGIYRIRYYFPASGNTKKDRSAMEDNISKVLFVFSEYDIKGFKLIRIEATTVSKIRKGVVLEAEITNAQFEKYKSSPQAFLIKDIEKFNFFDEFYE